MATASVKAPITRLHVFSHLKMAAQGANHYGRDFHGQWSSPEEEDLQVSEQEEHDGSSEILAVDDLELVKTLGTGTFEFC